MSIIDAKLLLSDNQSISATADTTNTLDFGGERELSNNYHGAGYVNIVITTAVAGTSATFKLQDSADNTSFADVAGTTVTLTTAPKGKIFTIKLPKTKRYVKGVFTVSGGTAGKATVFVGQPEA